MTRLTIPAVALLVLCASTAARAQDLDAFEVQLDETIRSACHGYLLDALPVALDWLRERIDTKSNLCRRVRALAEDEPLASARGDLRRAFGPELGSRVDRGIAEDIACDGEWMCVYVRTRFRESASPVDQASYDRVAAHCGARYGCIEAFFEDWPRAMPPPPAPDTGLGFGELLGRPSAAAPSPGAAIGFGAPRAADAPPAVAAPASAAFASSGPDAGAPATDLGSVLADRRARKVALARARLSDAASALQSACRCTFAGDGCYTLPSEALLERARSAERERQRLCLDGETLASTPQADQPATIDANSERLDAMREALARIDSGVDQAVAVWERERREQIARAQREAEARGDRALLAGVLTATAGAVAGHYTGAMTGEQAGQLGARVAQQIDAGGSAAGAISSGLGEIQSSTSSAPNAGMISSASGSFVLSCFDRRNAMCADYTFPDAQKRDAFAGRCRSLGSEVLAAACDPSGAIGCRTQAGATVSTTWAYQVDRNLFGSNCRNSGGQVVGGG